MVHVSQKLLKTPKLKLGESFAGYILRLAEDNGYSSPLWIINLANFSDKLILPNYSFKPVSSESFKLLADLSGSTISELAQASYQLADHNFHLFFGNSIHRFFIKQNHPKVCPECLREAAYCRRVWEFVLTTVCPIHKCLLLDECPNCKQSIKWMRTNVSSCVCKFDWRESTPSPIQDSELKLARIIYRLCGLSCGEGGRHFSPQNPALRLSLQDFTLAVIFMVGQFRGPSLTTSWPLLFTGKIKDLHHLFVGAYDVFDDWPNGFYEFLNWWRAQRKPTSSSYHRLKSVLYKDFGRLYTGLYKTLSARQFDFIRDTFIDYLVKEWEGCDLSAFALNKDVGQHRKVKFISKSDTKRLLGVDDMRINHFIQKGSLKTKVRSKGMKRLIFVDVADIAILMRETA